MASIGSACRKAETGRTAEPRYALGRFPCAIRHPPSAVRRPPSAVRREEVVVLIAVSLVCAVLAAA
ncbi:hypothetical protein, partial [Streptomyces sp. NPDC002619]|uniref:hypothetical protein n=1 Tax=Streptomyces sp. NPDC002619 TaxID=3364655 RepID=UPI00369A17A4